MKKSLLALAVLGAFVGVAQARDIGITADVGTTGVGFHLVVPVHERINARFGFNSFSHSMDESTNDASYDVDVKLRTFDALVDYYPTSSQFRLTGGIVYNDSKVSAKARPGAGSSYTFNGNTYSSAQVGDVGGNIDFNKVAPYVGIGWGNAIAEGKGWGFTADAGVIFQGSPSASLSSSNCTAGAAVCGQLASDLAAENASLNDDVNDFRYYPVIRVGATYKF